MFPIYVSTSTLELFSCGYRHLVTAHPGGSALLSDVVISSAVLAGDGVLADAVMTDVTNAGEGPSGGEYGVDPNVDPELAMVYNQI